MVPATVLSPAGTRRLQPRRPGQSPLIRAAPPPTFSHEGRRTVCYGRCERLRSSQLFHLGRKARLHAARRTGRGDGGVGGAPGIRPETVGVWVSANVRRSARTGFHMRGPWASLLTRGPSAHGGQGWQRPSPGPVRVSAPPPRPSGLPPGSTSHPLGQRPLTGSGFGLRPLHQLPPPLRIAGRASPRATGQGYYRGGGRRGGKLGCRKGQGVELAGV
jgi:hypothetical protein